MKFYGFFTGQVRTKWTKVSGKWNEIFDQTWTEAGKNASSRSSAQVDQFLDNFKSLPQDSSFSYEFDMTFPEAINVSQNPAVTEQYGAGFYFMAENPAAVYGNKSYLLFQTADTMKIFKGNGGTLTELASFAAPAETGQNSEPAIPLAFHYKIQYTPTTGEISLFRNDIFIGSYTDQSPLKSGQAIILMAHFTKTSFDNISVKAGTKTETKAFNTHGDHLGSSSIITAGLTLDGQKTSKTGKIVQLLDQYPYGEKRIDEKSTSITNGESGSNPDLSTSNISSFSTKKTFTGKELDAETGLYYYGARYYDARLGRFISADPTAKYTGSLLLFFDPQRFNSYSYANNNPVRYTDPDGASAENVLEWADDVGKAIGKGVSEGLAKSLSFLGKLALPLALIEGVLGNPNTTTTKDYCVKTCIEEYHDAQEAEANQKAQPVRSGKEGSTPAPADPGGSGPKKDDGKAGYDNIPDEMKRQVPKEWGKGETSSKGDEWRWANPKNDTQTVRYSPGKPNSPYSSQRQPYVKQTGSDGQPLDINGNRIKGRDGMRPSQTPESHIPASQWKFKP